MLNRKLLKVALARWRLKSRRGFAVESYEDGNKFTRQSLVASTHRATNQLKMQGWAIHSYGGLEELQFSDKLRLPKIRNASECLVKVHATSVNPIDVLMLGGYGATTLNVLRGSIGSIEFPLTLGREFCGEIVQKGMKVSDSHVSIGERVWGVVPIQDSGAHANYVVVPDFCLSPAPANLSDHEAASVLYAGLTAWSGLYLTGFLGGIQGAATPAAGGASKRILVLGGSGGVGSLAIQILKSQNAQVLATCSENAVDLVKNLGADIVIDYSNPEEIKNIRNFGPYDIILDCAGQGPNGAQNLNTEFKQYITFSSPLLRNIDTSGMALGLIKNVCSLVESNAQALTKQCGLVKWGFFTPAPQGIQLLKNLVERNKVLPVIDSCHQFSKLPEAFQRVKDGHLRGKVIVSVDDQNHQIL